MAEPCARIIDAATRRRIKLHASTEAMHELVVHRMRTGARSDAVAEARRVGLVAKLHPFDDAVSLSGLRVVRPDQVDLAGSG